MKVSKKITCRYGVQYAIELKGTKGEILRTIDMLSKCCCWVCHNHDCKEPKNEIIENCNHVCEIWTETHYCEPKIKL